MGLLDTIIGRAKNQAAVPPPERAWRVDAGAAKGGWSRNGLSFSPLEVEFGGYFGLQWSNTNQPTPGARSYAYETLALNPVDIIGPAVQVTGKPSVLPPSPMLAAQMHALQGMGIQAGTVWASGLYDPNSGQFGAAPNIGPDYNIPFARGAV